MKRDPELLEFSEHVRFIRSNQPFVSSADMIAQRDRVLKTTSPELSNGVSFGGSPRSTDSSSRTTR